MVMCKAPPMMVCDPTETGGPDLRDPASAGRQLYLKKVKTGGGTVAPGNFGLLATADGQNGAAAISDALAAVEPAGCYTSLVETATGSKTNKVETAINGRFDLVAATGPAAPNVIAHPRDTTVLTGAALGDGSWNRTTYWSQRHGGSLPAALGNAGRYQVYLYEIGLSFARRGRETFYPVPNPLPAGATLVTPPGASIPRSTSQPDNPFVDGRPTTDCHDEAGEQNRRLMVVPVMRCVEDNIHGSGTYPTRDRYLELFLTEPAESTPTSAILAEVVRAVTLSDSPDLHAYSRVVE